MDWLKLFALLVAVVSIVITAEGTRKKIRIHIPQKVKHIYHHKKIYITNHPASSQYAPAFLPTADSSLTIPNAAAVAPSNLLPLIPSPIFENRASKHLQIVDPSESQILPMYRERGFYGPSPEWEDQEFDLVSHPDTSGPTASAFLPTAFSSPMASENQIKRIKIIKVGDPRRKKKIVRKRKPKRIIIRDMVKDEDPHPVPSYHEQFYADIEEGGTIRKIKKPKRIEKFVDGDTEHIHTYSEEHIHKLVFDDPPKFTGMAGFDPTAHIADLSETHPANPFKNSQSILSMSPTRETLVSDFDMLPGTIGSLGTPSHMEYMGYDPRDVTHDHVFHDHGEISPTLGLFKDHLSIPPKVNYNTQSLKLFDPELTPKYRKKPKWSAQNNIYQSTKASPSPDFSYFSNMYTTTSRPKKIRRPTKRPIKINEDSSEIENLTKGFRPLPYFDFKEDPKIKSQDSMPYYGHNSANLNSYRHGQNSISVSSSPQSFFERPSSSQGNMYTNTKPFISTASIKQKEWNNPLRQFNNLYLNNFNFDNQASSSNTYNKDKPPSWPIQNKGKKKSVSSQNVNFGGQDHKTVVDHSADISHIEDNIPYISGNPSNSFANNKWVDVSTPRPSLFSITEKSPNHEYYTAMALKAFHDDHMSAASNNNVQIVDAPSTPTVPLAPMVSNMTPSFTHFMSPSIESTTITSPANRQSKKRLRFIKLQPPSQNFEQNKNENLHFSDVRVRDEANFRQIDSNSEPISNNIRFQRSRQFIRNFSNDMKKNNSEILPARGKFKYGDKL